MFALIASLAVIDATHITNIVSVVLFSTLLLRCLEGLSSAIIGVNSQLQFCMEVVSIALLVASLGLEIISVGFRSFSLGFRIFANVSAGHVLSDILLVSRYLAAASFLSVILQFTFSFAILAYELLVATIQLGVFLSLTSVYAE